jgi:hypothetical protein
MATETHKTLTCEAEIAMLLRRARMSIPEALAARGRAGVS